MPFQEDTFAALFKKYRLKSGFATLSELGHALAQEGFTYEDSLLSRWQKGSRIPKNRHLLISLISIFSKKNGLGTIGEANKLLASANQRDLEKKELELLSNMLKKKTPFTVPATSSLFIGREKFLQEICWHLINKQPILICGMAGAGKTVLAIKAAYILKEKFTDGTVWYRCDIKKLDDILDDLARILGEDVSRVEDRTAKIRMVFDLAYGKNMLLILDNVESFENIKPLLLYEKLPFSLLATSKRAFGALKKLKRIRIHGFTEKEMIKLAKKTLGTPFVILHVDKLKKLAKFVDYSPLALTVLFRRLETSPRSLKDFLLHFKKEAVFLYKSKYDDKTLYQSLNLSYLALSASTKQVFLSLGVFQGSNFSSRAVAFINRISSKEANGTLRYLHKFSLVEHFRNGRWRLHPLIKLFIKNKIKDKNLYKLLTSYFVHFLTRLGRGNLSRYDEIESELDNIQGVFEESYALGFYKEVVDLWEYLGVFLWDTRRWKNMEKYESLICTAGIRLRDKRALATCLLRELSWLHYWQGNIEKAEKSVKKGMKLAKGLGDESLLALVWIRLGKICQSRKKCQKALWYFKLALDYFNQKDSREKQGDIFTYFGETYWLMGQQKMAKRYLNRALRIVNEINDLPQKTTILSRLGCIALQEKRFTQAISYFKKSLMVKESLGRLIGDTFWNNIGLGLTYSMLGSRQLARQKFQLAKKEIAAVGFAERVLKIDVFPMIFKKELAKSEFYTVKAV